MKRRFDHQTYNLPSNVDISSKLSFSACSNASMSRGMPSEVDTESISIFTKMQ